MFYTMRYESPIGDSLLASDGTHLVGLWLEGQKHYCPLKEPLQEKDSDVILRQTKEWLDYYFVGEHPEISELPLRPMGSDFRRQVWEILVRIPYGEVMTYGEIAGIIARENNIEHMSAQAVGGAVGHNPISIIIPCHRVVGANGSLTGYAGGVEKKRWLLQHEGVMAYGFERTGEKTKNRYSNYLSVIER